MTCIVQYHILSAIRKELLDTTDRSTGGYQTLYAQPSAKRYHHQPMQTFILQLPQRATTPTAPINAMAAMPATPLNPVGAPESEDDVVETLCRVADEVEGMLELDDAVVIMFDHVELPVASASVVIPVGMATIVFIVSISPSSMSSEPPVCECEWPSDLGVAIGAGALGGGWRGFFGNWGDDDFDTSRTTKRGSKFHGGCVIFASFISQ